MLSRPILTFALFAIASLAGCCSPCSRVWTCGMGDCGPTGCNTGCGNGGIKGIMSGGIGNKCKGCGEVYLGEWRSDPPPACDPCDGCGNWTGSGCCSSGHCGAGTCGDSCGPACGGSCVGNLFGWLRGTRYYGDCGCGQAGCGGSCGLDGDYASSHAIYSEPTHGVPMRGVPSNRVHTTPERILDENWEIAPGPQPTPGKPTHNAKSPGGAKLSSRATPSSSRTTSVRPASSVASRASGRPASSSSTVRPASYEMQQR